MPKKIFPFKIGADPEFNLVFQDKRLQADTVLSHLLRKNFKNINGMGFQIGTAGNLGWDGCSSTGELRPNAGNTPEEVVNNLGIIFKTFSEISSAFSMTTSIGSMPIGGHIHFELPKEIQTNDAAVERVHKMITSFYLPIILGEKPQYIKARRRGGYGELTDYRISHPKSDVYTYELRSPGADWTTTPKIARSVLAYLATIYNEIIYHPETFKKKKIKEVMIRSNKDTILLDSISANRSFGFMERHFRKIRIVVKQFEFYKEYKEEIDYIFQTKRVLKDKEKVEFDIMRGWKLKKNPKVNLHSFISPEDKETSKFDLDKISNIVELPFNADMNVEYFIKELQNKILGLNIKLKNKYFFFGLKKGIENYIITNKNGEFIAGQDQIKTKLDLKAADQLLGRMNNRLTINYKDSLNPKNKKEGAEHILIGIPYKERQEKNTKKFLKIFYNLERKPIETSKIVNASLIDDSAMETTTDWTKETREKTGKLFSACFIIPKKKEEKKEEKTTDLKETDSTINQILATGITAEAISVATGTISKS